MTIVITRDVAPRFRGFLASCMLELAPGVYTSPRMTAAVRDRVWTVLSEWYSALGGGAIVMCWPDRKASSSQQVRLLGTAPVELIDHEGLILAVRKSSPADL